jgi:hypothetical protein
MARQMSRSQASAVGIGGEVAMKSLLALHRSADAYVV